MFCKNCGKEIDDGSKFCQYCGANLTASETDIKKEISKFTDNVKNYKCLTSHWLCFIGVVIVIFV